MGACRIDSKKARGETGSFRNQDGFISELPKGSKPKESENLANPVDHNAEIDLAVRIAARKGPDTSAEDFQL